jgi:hypothetical protein
MSLFLWKLLFKLAKSAIISGWLSAPITRLRIKAVSTYLKVVDGVRKGVLGAVALLLVLMLLITGFVAIHVGLFILFDWSLRTVGIVTLCLGGIYFLAPAIAIAVLTSERTWMKMSGGNELVRKVTKPKERKHRKEPEKEPVS